jgi:glycosyltransferase involved in cell wall biosynthesis
LIRFLNVNVFLEPRSGGGTAERTFQLSRALQAAGVDTTIACLDVGPIAERAAALKGTRVLALPCLQERFLLPGGGLGQLAREVRKADIVQLNNHWTALNAFVYHIARRAGKPWIVCPCGALPIFGRSTTLKRIYNRVVGRRLVQEAAAAVAITELEREQFEPYGRPAASVHVVPNGVAIEEFEEADVSAFRRNHGLADAPLVLFMGRLNEIKGPDLLLEAFARIHRSMPQHHLVFAGPDAGMRESLERSAHAAGLYRRVHFIGYVDGRAKTSAYRAAELVVVPSRREAMSIVALEAGACEKPVVLTDRCGFDRVQTLGAGMVVPAQVDALAGAMHCLLGQPEQRDRMGAAFFALVKKEYTWDAAALRYIGIFESIRARSA